MNTLNQKPSFIVNGLNVFSDWLGKTIRWLTLVMVVVTFAIVLLRYFFNVGWIAMQESVLWMHAIVFLLGAGYTLKQDGHVRVDIFYGKATPRRKAQVELFGFFFLLLPVVFFLFWINWEYVTDSWRIGEDSRETGGLPAIFLLKSALLLMPILLFLQGISQMLQAWVVLVREAKL